MGAKLTNFLDGNNMDAHIKFMPKISNREKILSEGLKLVHERGFGGASVRDIVQAAGVPQGSFTNHFASKEAFGLEIIELYLQESQKLADATLRNAHLPPLKRLEAYIDALREGHLRQGMKNGCLFGNFSAELGECSETIRLRIAAIFAGLQTAVAECLQAAVKAGDLAEDFACWDVAGFIVGSLQGNTLLCKAQLSIEPFDRFKRVLFTNVLGKDDVSAAKRTTKKS
jgi:TetR/AcrR family transcriptional repressor of nem operon